MKKPYMIFNVKVHVPFNNSVVDKHLSKYVSATIRSQLLSAPPRLASVTRDGDGDIISIELETP